MSGGSDYPKQPDICKGCYAATANITATICSLQPEWNNKQ